MWIISAVPSHAPGSSREVGAYIPHTRECSEKVVRRSGRHDSKSSDPSHTAIQMQTFFPDRNVPLPISRTSRAPLRSMAFEE